jgi:hypothetical protein
MVPVGGIIIWSGAIVDIPSNYQLCNGTNGTPDLNQRFAMGAGLSVNPNETGGELEHNHTLGGPPGIVDAGSGISVWPAGSSTTEVSSLPPFIALAHIQRMS